jgi:hypothetical protein
MKQIILFLLLATNVFSGLNAQTKEVNEAKETQVGIQIGPKIGYVNSTVYGSQVDIYSSGGYEFKRRNSLSIGIQAKTNILQWWYMKFELNLLQKGAEMGESNFVHPPKPYFTYFNIPVITGFRLLTIPNNLKIGLEVGVASNIELSNQENLDQGLYPTIYPSYDKHIIEVNYGLDVEFIITEKMSFSTNFRVFRDLDAFFERIDHFSPYATTDDEVEFRLTDMKHQGWNLNFTLNYTIRN